MRDINDNEVPTRDQNMDDNDSNEFLNKVVDDVAEAMEAAAMEDLRKRMDRAHVDAMRLVTEGVEAMLNECEKTEGEGGVLSIHALSLLSTFATLRNAAAQAVIAGEARRRTAQIEEVAEGVAESLSAKGGD